jgi:hypothetical protein
MCIPHTGCTGCVCGGGGGFSASEKIVVLHCVSLAEL